MREFKEDQLPKKSLLSLQIDLNKFSPATDEEKQQHETMRESTTFFRDGMRKLFKNPLAVASLIVLAVLLVIIAVVPSVYPYSYSQMIEVNGKRDKTAKNLAPFEYSENELKAIEEGQEIFPHIFGTDELCRDYFIRVVYGARVSLLVGAVLSVVNYLLQVLVFGRTWLVAFTVSVAMLATVVLSKCIGCLLPLGAKALKLDPALTATPLITTIVDTCSLILLFEIASVMLKGVA